MIRIFIVIGAAVLFVAWIGGGSVSDCEKAGNSTETCLAVMNP